MDELTLIRNLRSDETLPSRTELARGREALESHISESTAGGTKRRGSSAAVYRPLRWAATGMVAAAAAGLIAGTVHFGAQGALAQDTLLVAALSAADSDDLVLGDGQYLLARTEARYQSCVVTDDERETVCEPTESVTEVYMPAASDSEWVQIHQTLGSAPEVRTGDGGDFLGSGPVEFGEIPVDATLAYQWIDQQYTGGSSSRAEDNFDRIASLLRTGLVPGPQRAALLGALALIPGVTATDGVENNNGVVGVAIGRDEPVRFGQREEVIVDPETGMVIGERTITGSTFFGWGTNEVFTVTAIETTVVDSLPPGQ